MPKGSRRSEPKNWQPFIGGGSGIVARRSVPDPLFGHSTREGGLENFAMTQPMRLLQLLPSFHPSVGFALWSALRTMFPEEGFGMRAMSLDNRMALPASKQVPSPRGQVALDKMWDSQPQEIGGLRGLAITGAVQIMTTGLCCYEAVPGPIFGGVKYAWPVDSLSVLFVRPDRSSPLEAWQKQQYPGWIPGNAGQPQQLGAPSIVPGSSYSKLFGTERVNQLSLLGMQYMQMGPNFFWQALDSDVDDPYGTAAYATALSEAIADLALMQDLRDAVHNAAWPRMQVGVNLSELHRVAVEIHRITDAKAAAKWVMDRLAEIKAAVDGLGPDENVVCDSNGDLKLVQPGGFAGLEPVLNFLRQRIVQSLKTFPTLMGISDHSNVNVQSVEYGIYAAGLETIRAVVGAPLVAVANLHLRLSGINAKAVIDYPPIRRNDELVAANTTNVKQQNAINAEKMGYLSHSAAGLYVWDTEPDKEPRPGMLDAPITGQSFGEQSGQAGQKNAGTGPGANKQGTSKEDKSTGGGNGGSN